jgi:hypothetical protein
VTPSGSKVKVVDGERDEFGSTERCRKTKQHQRPIARTEQVIGGCGDQRADLRDGQVRLFGFAPRPACGGCL